MTTTICRLAFSRFVCFGLPLAQFAVACTMKRKKNNQLSIAEAFARCRGTKAEQRPTVNSESLDANSVSNSGSEPEKNDEGSSPLPASPPHSRCSSPAAEKSSQNETTSFNFRNDVGTLFVSSGDDFRWLVEPSTLRREEKAHLIEHHISPGYEFPAREHRKRADHISKRYFQRRWLLKHRWLVYSPACNGGFCLPCVLFGSGELSKREVHSTANR